MSLAYGRSSVTKILTSSSLSIRIIAYRIQLASRLHTPSIIGVHILPSSSCSVLIRPASWFVGGTYENDLHVNCQGRQVWDSNWGVEEGWEEQSEA
jgi:hypothetical protein